LVAALILAGMFTATLVAIGTAASPAGELVRYPNLSWNPLFGAVLCSALAFYLLRRTKCKGGPE
jgi:hypothetical protein